MSIFNWEKINPNVSLLEWTNSRMKKWCSKKLYCDYNIITKKRWTQAMVNLKKRHLCEWSFATNERATNQHLQLKMNGRRNQTTGLILTQKNQTTGLILTQKNQTTVLLTLVVLLGGPSATALGYVQPNMHPTITGGECSWFNLSIRIHPSMKIYHARIWCSDMFSRTCIRPSLAVSDVLSIWWKLFYYIKYFTVKKVELYLD